MADTEAAPAPAPAEEVIIDEKAIADALASLTVAKKKAKAKKPVVQENVVESAEHTYSEMLTRLYSELHSHRDGTSEEKRKIPPPNMSRVGSTRTAWTNFKRICDTLCRGTEHVLSFFLVELDTTGVIDGSENLVLRGRYLPSVIESILRQYIIEYVMCPMCKSLDTDLNRDAESRLYFLTCKACGSSRSVAPIKPGHHATTRADRRKLKQQAQ